MSALKKRKTFDIVHFIDSNNDNEKNKSVDCVPSSWIFYDKKMHQIMTKCMPPLYTPKKCNALHKLVKDNGNAPDKWPNYAVKIVESAGTYLEAIPKIEKLKHKDYICTTDQTDIEDENIENTNVQNAKKYVIPPIHDMKGNLSTRRNSSSSDSSMENEAEEFCTDESMNEEHEKSHRYLINQKIIYKNSQEKEPVIAAQIEKKATPKLKPASNDATSSNITIKYLKSILSEMQRLKHDQEIIKNDVRMLKEKFERYLLERNGENEVIPIHWTRQNNIQWPLKTKEDFDSLNKLLQNENIRNDFMATIAFIVDSRTALSKNLISVIRKFLHKDLTTKFTCVRQIKDKFLLKPSLFYNCIIEAFCAKRKSMQETFTEKTLEKLIAVVLTNSRNWEKGRLQKRDTDIVTEENETEVGEENVDNK